MVEFYERPLSKTVLLTGFEDETNSIEIPRDRFIQDIILRFVGTYDTTTAPTLKEDQPFSLINQLRLVANGNDVLRAISGINLHFLNWFDLHGTVLESVGIQATGSLADEAFSFALRLPFMINPLDPFDVGALLPAMDFSSLELYVDWAGAEELGDGTNPPTDLKGALQVSLREAFITQEEAGKLWGKNWEGLIKNYITEVVKTVDAKYGEFKFEQDLPTGMILRRTMLKVLDNTLRDNDLVPKYKISQESPVKRDLLEREWFRSQIQDKGEYRTGGVWTNGAGVASAITIDGVTIMDFEHLPCIDATGLKKGDVKFKANTETPTATANVSFITEEFI